MTDYDPADYLTPAEVAPLWRVSPEAVRKAIRAGRVPALRTPSGRYLIHRDDATPRATERTPK